MSNTIPNITIGSQNNPFQVTPPSNLQVNQIGWIEFLNESSRTLTINAGGVNIPIPAWTDYPLQVMERGRQLPGFNIPIMVTYNLLGSVQVGLSDVLIVTFYSPGETPSTTTPQPLVRQVETVGGVATSLVNTSEPIGAQIIHIQYAGDSGSEFDVSNDGHVQIGFGNAGARKLELGPGTNLQIDVPASLASGGQPTIGTNQITGNVEITTNGGLHQVTFIGNVNIIVDAGNGAISISNPGTTLIGGTNGTVTLHQDFTGTVKRVTLEFDNFQTAGVTQQIAIPVPFTDRILWRSGNIGSSANNQGVQFMASGVAQTVSVVTALASTGGTTTSVTTVYGNSFGSSVPFDTFRFQAGATAVMNGTLEVIGV